MRRLMFFKWQNSSNKFYARLSGGLGNQLFQYAIARSLALESGSKVSLDISGLCIERGSITRRDYELGVFNIKAAVDKKVRGLLYLIAKFIPFLFYLITGMKVIQEKNTKFNPSVMKISPPAYLVGHWQSYKYFEKYASVIREDLNPKARLSQTSRKHFETIVSDPCPVCIHVRRGDYLTNKSAAKFHGVLPKSYYVSAMGLVMNFHENAHFYFFSDDIGWCAREFAGYENATFIPNDLNKASWEDLFLMSKCHHHVIANSSYSWWGAWLGDEITNEQHIVIAPQKWYLEKDGDLSDRFPTHWKIL